LSALGIDLVPPSITRREAVDPGQVAELPRWARPQPPPPPLPGRASLWPVLSLGGSAAALIVAGLAANTRHFVFAGQAMVVAALAIAVFFLLRAREAEIKALIGEREADRRRADVYDRAGISIWREDWSAVGRRILELRTLGVTDIPRWFEGRPDEKQALHASVRITDVNHYTLALMGAAEKTQLLGSLAKVLPGSLNTFSHWLGHLDRGDEVYVSESHIQRLDGTPLDCLVTAALPANIEAFSDIVVSIIDISEYKQDQGRLAEAQAEVARAQRIATMGALTASIAHEVNSPLAAITSNAGACLRWLRRPTPNILEAEDAARSVIADAERAQAVIERTRNFLARSPRASARLDLPDLARDSAKLIEREAQKHGVRLHLDLPADLPVVRGDPIQVQQVLLNLMLNAIQAMADARGGGVLRVDAAVQDDHVSLTVSDTGPGIAADELERVFQPFYSTKDHGMGMGLAISRGCIEAHGGVMWMSSEPGGGARAHFTLPLSDEAGQ